MSKKSPLRWFIAVIVLASTGFSAGAYAGLWDSCADCHEECRSRNEREWQRCGTIGGGRRELQQCLGEARNKDRECHTMCTLRYCS